MRMAIAGEPQQTQILLRPLDLAWAYERARLLRRRDQDADAVASWIVAEPFQANMPPEIARAVWAERQILARKLRPFMVSPWAAKGAWKRNSWRVSLRCAF
jgi:soluble lytic murein transglycosylase